MKLAAKQCQKMDAKIMELHAKRLFSLSELNFMRRAGEAMIEVRKVLKYS